MTSFSDSVFYALSHGSLGFAFHGCFLTILWLVKIFQQPIRVFAMAVDRAAMENKTKATMWKSIKNWIRNRCHKWVYILFGSPVKKTNSDRFFFWTLGIQFDHPKQRLLEHCFYWRIFLPKRIHIKVFRYMNTQWHVVPLELKFSELECVAVSRIISPGFWAGHISL